MVLFRSKGFIKTEVVLFSFTKIDIVKFVCVCFGF